MGLKIVKTDSFIIDEQTLNGTTSANEVRSQVIQSARNFKESWKDLARSLHIVWEEKFYKEWGYDTFDRYTTKEIHIRKHTAMKLIHSYSFLQKEEIKPLKHQDGAAEETTALSFEAVNLLRQAKKNLDNDTYKNIKKDILGEKNNLEDIKKDLTLLIRQRKDIDPEAERKKQNSIIIKRFLSTLKALKRDIEFLKLLPMPITKNIDELIHKIENQIS